MPATQAYRSHSLEVRAATTMRSSPLASRLASRDVQKGLTGKPEFRLNPPFSKVAQGRSNKEIAAELVISERAARSHVSTYCPSLI